MRIKKILLLEKWILMFYVYMSLHIMRNNFVVKIMYLKGKYIVVYFVRDH